MKQDCTPGRYSNGKGKKDLVFPCSAQAKKDFVRKKRSVCIAGSIHVKNFQGHRKLLEFENNRLQNVAKCC